MCKDLLSSVVETDFFELIKSNFWATFSWNEQLLGNFCKFLGQLLRDIQATCVKAYNGPGPLFLFQDGRLLSRSLLTAWLCRILASAGISGNFSSHSFRIGAATVAACNGIPDHQIQALGRWSSTAYLSYIRTPAEMLSKLSKQLTAGATPWL